MQGIEGSTRKGLPAWSTAGRDGQDAVEKRRRQRQKEQDWLEAMTRSRAPSMQAGLVELGLPERVAIAAR